MRRLAEHLDVPRRVIDKPPSAGLWADQTDEGEMGLTYEELDAYLLTGEASPAVKARVDGHERASAHKRELPPIAPQARRLRRQPPRGGLAVAGRAWHTPLN